MSHDLWGTNCGEISHGHQTLGGLKRDFFNDLAEYRGLEVLIIEALRQPFCLGEATVSENKCLQNTRPSVKQYNSSKE